MRRGKEAAIARRLGTPTRDARRAIGKAVRAFAISETRWEAVRKQAAYASGGAADATKERMLGHEASPTDLKQQRHTWNFARGGLPYAHR